MISDQAFILHKRPYKDSSELIKLFTANHGVIDVLGKGSRRPKSKIKGQLQSFIPTQVVFSGRGSLKNLISAEQTGVLTATKYANHVSMLYCNELLV
ncbi:MAG: DNA repair protein RecO, partial [Marinicella sp.]